MAELLGVIASGITVVSLAIEVAESIQKLKAIHSLVADAPEDLRLALDEVEILSLILEDVDRSIQEQLFLDPRTKVAVAKSYRLCWSSGEALKSLVKQLEQGMFKGKKRGGLKVAMKKDEMELFRKRLDGAKSTMLLANQCFESAIQRQKWESHERDMLEIRSAVSEISRRGRLLEPLEGPEVCASEESDSDTEEGGRSKNQAPKQSSSQFSRYSKWGRQEMKITQQGMNRLFGLIDLVMSCDGSRTMTSIALGLPSWIYARRYELRLAKSCQGWDQSFRSYRMISYDAPVFHYSMAGDVVGLQQLFETGQSSPFEIDPDGRTPLHYAAMYARPKACHFLLENGADANARTSWYGEFDRRLLEIGNGWYPTMFYVSKEDIYRGRPGYSTPLHLLGGAAAAFSVEGRASLTSTHYKSNRPIEEDLYDTMKALAAGGSDPFCKDQFDLTTFHMLDDSTKIWQWLRREEEIQIASIAAEELHDLLAFRAHIVWDCSAETIMDFMPGGRITRELAQIFFKLRYSKVTLLHLATMNWSIVLVVTDDKRAGRNWENMITELLAAGADLHALTTSRDDAYTVLLYLIHTLLVYRFKEVKRLVKRWLEILKETGVNLVEYGRVENDMYESNEASWTFNLDLENCLRPENWCTFEMLELRIGESPEDFYIEFEDLYVSAELAADFWLWIEAPPDEDFAAIPGAWCED